MGKNKLKRFAEMMHFANVFQNYSYDHPVICGKQREEKDFKGRWAQGCFGNAHPIVLELACGGGEYTIQLAKHNSNINVIGLDIKGARIYKGAKKGLKEGIQNAVFLRTRIELVEFFFGKKEVSEIWITFPDPFLKESDENKRLTSPNFLNRYVPILKKDAKLHLKTDSIELYEYSMDIFNADKQWNVLIQTDDVYKDELVHPALVFKTFYEKKHLMKGKKIKYLQVQYCG